MEPQVGGDLFDPGMEQKGTSHHLIALFPTVAGKAHLSRGVTQNFAMKSRT
jgi:hypothetical protein